MDRLQAMTAFVAVVDCGGFARASRKLELSPPVVTRAVAELEARLGLRLLTRTTRIVRVTEAGGRFADDCRRILAQIDEAETAAAGTHAAARGTLALTAPVLFGHLYVTPILADYLQQHPQVDAQCLFVDRVVNFDEERVDVAIRIGELPDSSLQAVKVGQVRRVLVASPRYLQAHGVQARMRTTTNDSAIAAAEAGLGITRLLSYQAAASLRSGSLHKVLEAFEPAPLPIHVVHREGRHATQKVRGFIDLVVSRLRADAALR